MNIPMISPKPESSFCIGQVITWPEPPVGTIFRPLIQQHKDITYTNRPKVFAQQKFCIAYSQNLVA